jgi:hypothetical protein
MEHIFKGSWITNDEFCHLAPRNVFHKQLDKIKLDCSEHLNRHVLFRKSFNLDKSPENAVIYITADDYYKLYVNGSFVAQGPAPSYHFNYNYNKIDLAPYLKKGKNLIAVHTLYQGLINRVWQSSDNRHGLILDLEIDGKTLIKSDESFKTARHSAYRETGTCGYKTQFLENYDSIDDLISRITEIGYLPEGVVASRYIHRLSEQNGLKLPICEGIYQILNKEIKPLDLLARLRK